MSKLVSAVGMLLLLLLKGEVGEIVRVEGPLEAEMVAIDCFPGICVLVRVVVDGAVSVIDVVDVK